MEKKIIAISLVLVLMVTAFVGCTQKLETKVINGTNYVLATDKEGNTIINDKNQIAVYPTDKNGKIQKDENGEPKTNLVQLFGDIVGNDYIKGSVYKMNALEGWTPGTLGRIFKNETDSKCYVQFVEVMEVSKEKGISEYLETIDSQNVALEVGFKEQGYNCTISKGTSTITGINYTCYSYSYKIVDNENKTVHYAENYYFSTAETVYKLAYVCTDGVGYDETFNFNQYLNENLTFIEE